MMKKICMILILALTGISAAYAQDYSVQTKFGIPFGQEEESSEAEPITETAKVVFSRNSEDQIVAVVIHYTEDGSYPRSGWTTCAVIAPAVLEQYAGRLEKGESREGYFIATYVKKGQNPKSVILNYQGELLALKPWNPQFKK